MLIISPLEQFNVMSLCAITPFGGFEINVAMCLHMAWSLFYIYPVSALQLFLNNDFFFFYFLSFLAPLVIDTVSTLLNPFIHVFGLLLYAGSKLYLEAHLEVIFALGSWAQTFLHSGLSSVWAYVSLNSDIFYSADQLFLTILNPGAEELNKSGAALSSVGNDFSNDIGIIFAAADFIGSNSYLADARFMFLELIFAVYAFVCSVTIDKILPNGLTCDLSFLIFSLDVSTIWQAFGAATLLIIFLTTTWNGALTLVAKNRWQTLLEIFYQVILNVVNENAGPKGRKFFPLIFTTFALILTCNVLGMIPYSFTVTSHLIVTFCTALAIFTGMNILGILKHRKHFLSLFFPPGAPLALAPLLVLIEFISYVFRVLSLSIRLFANLMSGHTLLKILATFSWGVVSLWGLLLLPVVIILIVTGLEMAIAFLQAYIFSVLLCIYLNDAFNLH